MGRCVVYTGWDGCGTTAAFVFFNSIGKSRGWRGSQWASSPFVRVSNGMSVDHDLEVIWSSCLSSYVGQTDFGGFSGWPYSLFYKQWDRDYDSVFVHATKNTEDWAYREIGYHTNRTIPSVYYQNHVEYIYGVRLDGDSPIEDWQTWIDRYKKHNVDILEYFTGKGNRFITIDLDTETDVAIGKKICELMEIEYNEETFPIDPDVNPAEWNNPTHIQLLMTDSFQELWNSRKSDLIF